MTSPLAVVTRYFDALESGDFATVSAQFADDIVWHQPGANRFSGTHRGSGAVCEMIGGMMTVSEGTFALATTGAARRTASTCSASSTTGSPRRGCSPPTRRPRTPSGAPAERPTGRRTTGPDVRRLLPHSQ
ncbi:MAG: uncharacterized protein QOF58_4659 [Pseudonocardiales bacterium]|nr:uncharacterized protein [Pseudonocardiales bacterium]